jgi:hypothetical protein
VKKRYTRAELGAELRARGFPISISKLNKLCAPSVNQGPPVAGWWGPRPLYELDGAVAWAESLLRSERSSLQNLLSNQDVAAKTSGAAMEASK